MWSRPPAANVTHFLGRYLFNAFNGVHISTFEMGIAQHKKNMPKISSGTPSPQWNSPPLGSKKKWLIFESQYLISKPFYFEMGKVNKSPWWISAVFGKKKKVLQFLISTASLAQMRKRANIFENDRSKVDTELKIILKRQK